MLNKIVKVTIDRQIGTCHPNHSDIIYPINYGYIEGIIAPDGEEQDAYILGINYPLKKFEGKVIAIVHRFDDNEEKWVVASANAHYTKEEIVKQINFQEQFFKYKIIM